MAELSVIIVSYNTKELTLKCIESVFECSAGLEVEVIVIENDSRDGSREALKKLKPLYKDRFKLIENDQNLGFAKAVNQGIKASSGRQVLLLNSDCEVRAGALKKLYEFAEKTEDAGVVGAKLLDPDGSTQPSCYFFPGILNVLGSYLGGKNRIDKYYPKGSKASEVEAVVFAASLISRSALENVGLLDERYFMYFEDLDYCKRVWHMGLKVYYLPSAEIVHHHGASGKGISDSANQWRRLIPSSKLYHGRFKHYLIVLIMRLGQKWERFRGKEKASSN
jgi:hypothetical protein